MNLRSINLSLSAELTKMFGVNLGMARTVQLTLSTDGAPTLEVENLVLDLKSTSTKRYTVVEEQ